MFDYVVQELRTAGFSGEIVQNAESVYWSWKLMPKNSGWILDNRCGMSKVHREHRVDSHTQTVIPFGIDLVWREDNHSRGVQLFLDNLGAAA